MLLSLLSDEPINPSTADDIVGQVSWDDPANVLEYEVLKALDSAKRIPITKPRTGVPAGYHWHQDFHAIPEKLLAGEYAR